MTPHREKELRDEWDKIRRDLGHEHREIADYWLTIIKSEINKVLEGVEKEMIICSAILMADGCIIRGHRHHNCIATISDIPRYRADNRYIESGVQGFVTSKNRFVTREEAKILAVNAGQLTKSTSNERLFSEDLY